MPAAFLLITWKISGEESLKLALKKSTPMVFNYIRSFILVYDIDTPGVAEKLDLPLFELLIAPKDMHHFDALRDSLGLTAKRKTPEYYVKNNQWIDANLLYNGDKYRIKIKSHARNPSNHRNWNSISYGVKLEDGRQINGVKRFNLIVRTHIQPVKQITFDLAERFGVIANRETLARVRINGGADKIYYFDHRLSDEYMESIGLSSFRLFGFSETESEASVKSSIFPLIQYDENLLREKLSETLVELEYPEEARNSIFQRYLDINRAVVNDNWETADKFFDLDYISSFEAARTIANHYGHGYYIANLYMFLNTANGKFYPAFTRDNISRKLNADTNLSIEQQVNLYPFHILGLVSKNEIIRQQKYKKLYSFILEHGYNVAAEQTAIVKKFETLSLLGHIQNALRKTGRYDTDIAGHNLRIIKKYIEESHPEIGISTAPNSINIALDPKSMAGLRFNTFNISECPREWNDGVPVEYVISEFTEGNAPHGTKHSIILPCHNGGISLIPALEEVLFSTALGKNLEKTRRTYLLSFTFKTDNVISIPNKSISYELKNSVTGQTTIPAINNNIWSDLDISSLKIIEWVNPVEKFISDNNLENIAVPENNSVVFLPGHHKILSDLILPDGVHLVLHADTELSLGENVLITGNNGISVYGTEEAPVIITSLVPGEPFGSVGILGTKTTTSDINYLILSDGNERWLDGTYFSGGLSIHYNDEVTVRNSIISGNHADDGMNIKYSNNVDLKRNKFQFNFADQVDLDYCTGFVSENTFHKTSAGPDNGDGLDVSGSWIIAERNLFQGLGDKGISVGENTSIFIADNSFVSNNIGSAVKDNSHAYFYDNHFENNSLDISAYQKKDFFGGGNVYVFRSGTSHPPEKFHADNRSLISEIALPENEHGIVFSPEKSESPATFFKRIASYTSGAFNLQN